MAESLITVFLIFQFIDIWIKLLPSKSQWFMYGSTFTLVCVIVSQFMWPGLWLQVLRAAVQDMRTVPNVSSNLTPRDTDKVSSGAGFSNIVRNDLVAGLENEPQVRSYKQDPPAGALEPTNATVQVWFKVYTPRSATYDMNRRESVETKKGEHYEAFLYKLKLTQAKSVTLFLRITNYSYHSYVFPALNRTINGKLKIAEKTALTDNISSQRYAVTDFGTINEPYNSWSMNKDLIIGPNSYEDIYITFADEDEGIRKGMLYFNFRLDLGTDNTNFGTIDMIKLSDGLPK